MKEGQISAGSEFAFATVNHLTNETTRPLVTLSTPSGGRYLFGKMCEGSQRLMGSYKLRYGNLRGLFMSGTINSWDDIGGLPGFFLTVSDANKKNINVMGNRELITYIIATWRQFVFRKGIKIHAAEPETGPIHADKEVNVFHIKIPREEPSHTIHRATLKEHQSALEKLISLMFPLDTSVVNSKDPDSYKNLVPNLHQFVKLPPAPEAYQSQESYSYLVRILPSPGKFDVKRAIALGLKPGPVFRQLQFGNAVQNENGDTIYPNQVLGETRTFQKVLIIDIPNNSYYKNTIKSEEWFRKDDERGHEEIGLVYHFLGNDVDFNLEKYTSDFLNKFPSETRHVISHVSMTNNTLLNVRSVHNNLILKSVMDENYNIPDLEAYQPLDPNDRITRLHSLQKFNIRYEGIAPNYSSIIQKGNQEIYEQEVVPVLQDKLPMKPYSEFESTKVNFNADKNQPLKDQVHIMTIGTGSSLPTIARNVIANMVRIPYQKEKGGDVSYRSVLLDGGENTLGNLKRMVDSQQLEQLFKELSLIFLSHLHADHHLGIASMINKWFEVNHGNDDARLHLIAPHDYIAFINDWYSLEKNYNKFYNAGKLCIFNVEEFFRNLVGCYKQIDLQEFERKYDYNDCRIPPKVPVEADPGKINEMYKYIGLNEVKFVRALHCPFSYSSIMDYKLSEYQNFVVSYSGDTRPNPAFSKVGHGSDLLIHEATFGNDFAKDAVEKKHSTMIEAIYTGLRMNCSKLILTHFSSRFANSNNSIQRCKMSEAVHHVNEYLKNENSQPNIFDFDVTQNPAKSRKTYENLDMCFAYDLMNVKFGDIHLQEQHWDIFNEIFIPGMNEREADETFEEEGLPSKELPAKRRKIVNEWY